MVRLASFLVCLLWACAAIAEAPSICGNAEALRVSGLRSIDENCSGPNIDALSCYNAARVFLRGIKNLQRLHPDALPQCPGFGAHELEAAVMGAGKITSLLASEAYEALHLQIADDRASLLGYTMLRIYACQYIVNTFAEQQQVPADVVHMTPTFYIDDVGSAWSWQRIQEWIVSLKTGWRPDPYDRSRTQNRFGTVRNGDVCGRITYWPAVGAGKLTREFEGAYLGVAEKLRAAAFAIAGAFLPERQGAASPSIGQAERIIAEFRREVAEKIRALKLAHHENGGVTRHGDVPVANGPDVPILESNYEDAGLAYAKFSKWLRGTAFRQYSGN